ncbi:MAG: hypothetical protein D6707_03400 [Bacteroidetes bacterium]|nr:MAG: hypothetical protein D6707_03400 [Bacteroidota bacterium]
MLFCILSGGFYALLLYFREKQLSDFSKKQIYFLAFLRFIVVFFITLLLFNPLIKQKKTEKEPPIIIFAQDVSKSIVYNSDSVYYRSKYPKQVKQFLQQLNTRYAVKPLSFSENVTDSLSFNFNSEYTDFSKLEKYLYDTYLGQNIGAVILATDGIYNRGKNPKYLFQKISAPIYTVALGDSSLKEDAAIQEIDLNNIVFSGNDFPVTVHLSAKLCKNEKATLSIKQNGKTIQSKTVVFSSDDDFKSISFILNAGTQKGILKYTAELSPLKDEVSTKNNVKTFFIEVIDNRKKILLLGNAPHPDLGTIKRILEKNAGYEVTVSFISDFNENIEKYHLVILHNLPSKKNAAGKVFNSLAKSNVPYWMICGSQIHIQTLNKYNLPIRIKNGLQHQTTEFQVIKNDNFTLFQTDDITLTTDFPPLTSVFGKVYISKNPQTLFFQKISNVPTDYPAFAFINSGNRKSAYLTGEGFWKWMLAEYAQTEKQENVQNIISKAVQYLVLKEDKSRLKVFVNKQFYETDKILFKAEVYDKIFEPVLNADVQLIITNENNVEYAYVIPPHKKGYKLSVNGLPPGKYHYKASVVLDGEKLEREGEILVKPVDIESLNTRANFSVLRELSSTHGGKVIFPNQLDALAKHLLNDGRIQPVVYTIESLEDFINIKWLFFLILALITLEWFMRRYLGVY